LQVASQQRCQWELVEEQNERAAKPVVLCVLVKELLIAV
jgi:hypothetical protein